jgi:hypothetical protein
MKHPIALLWALLTPLVWESCVIESVTAASTVVYDSFNVNNAFLTSGGWGVIGASASGGYRGQAQSFVPTLSGSLATIELAIGRSSGSGRNNFGIAQDSGGSPGTILEGFQNVVAAGTFGSSYPPLALTSALHPVLESGQRYWIIAEPADSTTRSAWNYNTKGFSGIAAFERAPSTWQTFDTSFAGGDGVFRVSVTPVPEPSIVTVSLFALVLAAIRFRNTKSSS